MGECFLDWWREHGSGYRAVLLDIDGTLKTGRRALPNAVRTLAWLREHDFPFRLLTNDGNNSPRQKCRALARAGLEVAEAEIVSCGMALAKYAADPKWRGRRFYVVGDLGDPSYADTAGLRTARDARALDDCAAIVVGEGDYDWRIELSAALNALLRDPGKRLIVPNPDSYWPNGADGEIGIGAGGKARFLLSILREAGVVLEPDYLGKPYPPIFQLALASLRESAADQEWSGEPVLMLGDSLKSDIVGANRHGLTSGLVLTGITNRKMADAATGDERPDWVFDTL